MHLRHEILLNYTLILVSNKWGIQLLGHKDGTRTQEFMKFLSLPFYRLQVVQLQCQALKNQTRPGPELDNKSPFKSCLKSLLKYPSMSHSKSSLC